MGGAASTKLKCPKHASETFQTLFGDKTNKKALLKLKRIYVKIRAD